MWTKPYGRTGKDVSVIGFGGMRFERPLDIDASAAVVLHAYGKGVNYFDTAPYYCKDRSEDIMGAAFRAMRPGTFFVSTKSGEPEGDKLRRDLEKSLKRLGVPRINFFHLWCIITLEAWKGRIEKGAVAAALKAKEEGLIEHVVVSSHLPGADLAKVLADAPVEGVTLGYCAINFPYRQAAVDAAGRHGLGVVTMNPLGGGLIPQNAAKFDFLRGPGDKSVVEAAIRFNISQPAITCALVGFSTTQQVDQAVAAVDGFRPYPKKHVDSIRRKVMASFNSLCTGCGYCLPCPAGINIPQMMDSYNHKLLRGGDPKEISARLSDHWESSPQPATTCSLCGQCEERCTQRLPIRERMKEIASLAKG
ncbi:MAG: aldo/keto reductase [Phycisphaerae bacterium]